MITPSHVPEVRVAYPTFESSSHFALQLTLHVSPADENAADVGRFPAMRFTTKNVRDSAVIRLASSL